MATVIDISTAINRDKESLFVWANLPQQREKYPDFERLLKALPWTSERHVADSSRSDVVYVHLAVERDGCKGLYIRLNKSTDERGPNQLAFLSEKEGEGFGCANCFGWEDARDAIISYMNADEAKLARAKSID